VFSIRNSIIGMRSKTSEVSSSVADGITVMDRGMVPAEGTPGEVQANADVQRAYLGV
jgi:branched-chain amino acid transport system ATP-binding protein